MSASEPQRNRVARGLVTALVAVVIWLLPIPPGSNSRPGTSCHLFRNHHRLILQPLPMGAVVFIGTTATALTDTLSIGDALNGFMNGTVWLIVVAFLFARAFTRPVLAVASPTLHPGLRPSDAGVGLRAGRQRLGAAPAFRPAPPGPAACSFPSSRTWPQLRLRTWADGGRIGSFLMLSAYQVHGVTCAMFLTSMRPTR